MGDLMWLNGFFNLLVIYKNIHLCTFILCYLLCFIYLFLLMKRSLPALARHFFLRQQSMCLLFILSEQCCHVLLLYSCINGPFSRIVTHFDQLVLGSCQPSPLYIMCLFSSCVSAFFKASPLEWCINTCFFHSWEEIMYWLSQLSKFYICNIVFLFI